MNAVELRRMAIVIWIAVPVIIDAASGREISAADKPQVAPKEDKAKSLEKRRSNSELDRKIANLTPQQRKRLNVFQSELKKRCGKEANDPETWFVLVCTDEIIFRNVGAFSNKSGMMTKKSVIAEVQRKHYTHHAIKVSGLKAAAFALVEFDSRPPTEALYEIDKSRAQRFKLEPKKTYQASTFESEEKASQHAERVDGNHFPKAKD